MLTAPPMPMQNLTGISNDIWGQMSSGGQTMNTLSEAEKIQRKRKVMAAAGPTDTTSVMAYLFGDRMNSGYGGGPRA